MTSPVFRTRRGLASSATVGVTVLAVALSAGDVRAQGAEPAAPPAVAGAPKPGLDEGRHPFSERFPNLVLKTHQGAHVRFYDDLLKGKIVLINFMYATCKGR